MQENNDNDEIGIATVEGQLHSPEECITAIQKIKNKYFNVYTLLTRGIVDRVIIKSYPDYVYIYDHKTDTFSYADEEFNPEDDYIALDDIFSDNEKIGMSVIQYTTFSYYIFRLKQYTIYKLLYKMRNKKC